MLDLTQAPMGADELRSDALELLEFMRGLGVPEGSRVGLIRTDPDERTTLFAQMARLDQPLELRYFPHREPALAWLMVT